MIPYQSSPLMFTFINYNNNSCKNRHKFRGGKERKKGGIKKASVFVVLCFPHFLYIFLLFLYNSSSKSKPHILFSILFPLTLLFMDETAHKHKQRMMEKEKVKKEALDGDEEGEYRGVVEEDKKRKGIIIVGSGSGKKLSGAGVGGGGMRCCQAENCMTDLSEAKPYHRRHKVCELHAKAQDVLVGGFRQRFCQQCSRFHELSEFDETKRSCRRRLAGHNERRRKNSAETYAECSIRKGSGTQMKDCVCGQVDDKGRIQFTIQENAAYKHFQIR